MTVSCVSPGGVEMCGVLVHQMGVFSPARTTEVLNLKERETADFQDRKIESDYFDFDGQWR